MGQIVCKIYVSQAKFLLKIIFDKQIFCKVRQQSHQVVVNAVFKLLQICNLSLKLNSGLF